MENGKEKIKKNKINKAENIDKSLIDRSLLTKPKNQGKIKKVTESETIVTDSQTGEILQSTKELGIVRVVAADEFIKVYLSDISGIIGIGSGKDRDILACFFQIAGYGTNEFFAVKSVKEKIATALNTTLGNIDNAIKKFCSKNILIRKDRSVYILNPKYFFKGEDIKRNEVLTLVSTYMLK